MCIKLDHRAPGAVRQRVTIDMMCSGFNLYSREWEYFIFSASWETEHDSKTRTQSLDTSLSEQRRIHYLIITSGDIICPLFPLPGRQSTSLSSVTGHARSQKLGKKHAQSNIRFLFI